MWQTLKGNTHDYIITFVLQDFIQMRIQNPVEHLSWSFLQISLTGKSC